MQDKWSVFLLPEIGKVDGKREITGWGFQVHKNGQHVASGTGYESPDDARKAGQVHLP